MQVNPISQIRGNYIFYYTGIFQCKMNIMWNETASMHINYKIPFLNNSVAIIVNNNPIIIGFGGTSHCFHSIRNVFNHNHDGEFMSYADQSFCSATGYLTRLRRLHADHKIKFAFTLI